MSHNKSCWYPCISISQHLSYHWIHGHALLKEEHAQVASWWCGFMLEIFDMCMHCMLGQDCLDISMQSWTEQPHQSTCMMVSITVACYKLSSHKTGMPAILPHCFENSSKPNRSTTHVINIDGNLCFIFRTWIGHSICCHTQPWLHQVIMEWFIEVALFCKVNYVWILDIFYVVLDVMKQTRYWQ